MDGNSISGIRLKAVQPSAERGRPLLICRTNGRSDTQKTEIESSQQAFFKILKYFSLKVTRTVKVMQNFKTYRLHLIDLRDQAISNCETESFDEKLIRDKERVI